VLRTGGASKSDLLTELEVAGVRLNDAARALFDQDRFTTSAVPSLMAIAELSVADLGLGDGGRFDDIVDRAARLGLSLCPLELAPHFRLQCLEQPEGFLGNPPSQGRAPPGSITVASAAPAEEGSPAGFYLRRIEGALWLRGYRSWSGHIWSPQDVLAFACARDAA
jgi:hypothetical protein